MNTVDYLKAAREFIVKGWAHPDTLAFDADRNPCPPYDKEAVSWDILGAVYAVRLTPAGSKLDEDQRRKLHEDASVALRLFVPRGRLGMWNDAPGRTKEEVLELYDKAIALASTEEGQERIRKFLEESAEKLRRFKEKHADPADWWKKEE